MEGRSTERIAAALAEQCGRLEAHRVVATERDVHRCRVATRRARAVIRATRPLLGDALRPLEYELRWLAAMLAPVHELDSLLAHIRPQIETLGPETDGVKLVTATLDRQRYFRHEELRTALESDRFGELLRSFGDRLAALPADDTSFRPLITVELNRTRRAALRFGRSNSDEMLNALGLRAARARYAAELAGTPKAVRVAKALARLQRLAGTHQDAVLAEARLRSLSRPKTALAVGRLIEREHARRRAQRAALPAVFAKLGG